MYTRNYQLKREAAPMRTDEAREPEPLPSIMEEPCDTALIEPVADENAPADEPTPSPETKKRRFKAVRAPIFKEPICVEMPVCKDEPVQREIAECPQKKPRQSEKGGFFRDLSADEMLIIALIVLLLCEGGDDILILALCFVLA